MNPVHPGNPICQVCAASMQIFVGEVNPGRMKNGEPRSLKGVGHSSGVSLLQGAVVDISYYSSANPQLAWVGVQ